MIEENAPLSSPPNVLLVFLSVPSLLDFLLWKVVTAMPQFNL